MGSRKVLELFYDVLSPYSWLGFEVMCRYRSIWNVEVRLRPGLLAGIMKESGNKAPAMVPNKGAYMAHDLRRLAKYFQVPLQQPKDFFDVVLMKGSLPAMRFVTAVDLEQPEFVEPLSRELWKRIWSTDEDITRPESILSSPPPAPTTNPLMKRYPIQGQPRRRNTMAAQKAGLSSVQAQKLLGMCATAEVKERLKQTTDEALKYGAFGMPTIVAHVDGQPHMFFGSDRFELLADILGEKWLGPVPAGQKSLL